MKGLNLRSVFVPTALALAMLAAVPILTSDLMATLGFSEGFAFWLVSAIELVGAAAVWIPYGGWVIDSAALIIEIYGGDAAVVW